MPASIALNNFIYHKPGSKQYSNGDDDLRNDLMCTSKLTKSLAYSAKVNKKLISR